MINYQSTPDFYNDYIQHFNPFHDPRNGQFTTGHGGGSITRLQKKAAKASVKAAKAKYKADKLNAKLNKVELKKNKQAENSNKIVDASLKGTKELEKELASQFLSKQSGADLYAKKQLSKTDQQKISKEVKRARETGMYNMEFLERNLDLDPVTEEQMKGKALDNAYKKFLEDELKKNNK